MVGEIAFWSRALLVLFPLKVIAIGSPDIGQRERAVRMLKRWGFGEGLRGICRNSARLLGRKRRAIVSLEEGCLNPTGRWRTKYMNGVNESHGAGYLMLNFRT